MESTKWTSRRRKPSTTSSSLLAQRAADLFLLAERLEDRGDYEGAVACLRASAKLGHVDSQLNLGNMYADGKGAPRNFSIAQRWYRKAFANGSATAARNLAIDKIAAGKVRSAQYWLKRGVDLGDGGAHVLLAKQYAPFPDKRSRALELLEAVLHLDDSGASKVDVEEAKKLIATLRKRRMFKSRVQPAVRGSEPR